MSIKISALTAILLSTMSASVVVHADTQSITAGYAQAHVQDFKNINGVNLKYRYEWNSPLSVMTSFSFMSGSKSTSYYATQDIINHSANVKYYSLAAGPAWRFNDMVSAYGLVGASYSKTKYNYNWKNYEGDHNYDDMVNFSGKNDSTSLMYSAGIQINPVHNMVIDVAYEGSKLDDGGRDLSINGFNVGVGYRF